jgi:hypothetical protein
VVKIGNENSAAASCSSDGAGDENKYAFSWGGQEMANDSISYRRRTINFRNMCRRFIYMGFEELVVGMRHELDFHRKSHNYSTQVYQLNRCKCCGNCRQYTVVGILYRSQTHFVSNCSYSISVFQFGYISLRKMYIKFTKWLRVMKIVAV